MKLENLLISYLHNPYAYHCDAEMVSFGEVDSGSWWQTAQQHECTNKNNMLWPLMMFIDRMKVDNLDS
jgi:hypothetical protein